MSDRLFEQAKEALRSLHKANTPISATVTTVDEDKRTCDVKLDNGMDIYDVMLTAQRGASKGAVSIPAVNSTIQMLAIGDVDFIMLSCDDIQKILWDVDGTTLEVQKDLFQIAGGGNGGIPMIKELTDNLNALKKFVEQMHSSLPDAFTAIGIGTSANGGTGATKYSTGMVGQSIQFKDMENTKAKH